MADEDAKTIGAGGSWKAIDEKSDATVVKQVTPLSCVAAVGEMLLRSRGISVPQEAIIGIIEEPSSIGELADYLNTVDVEKKHTKWYGSIVERRNILLLLREGQFGAVLRDGSALGHLVVVHAADARRLKIKDPWGGTRTSCHSSSISDIWNGEAVFRWNL